MHALGLLLGGLGLNLPLSRESQFLLEPVPALLALLRSSTTRPLSHLLTDCGWLPYDYDDTVVSLPFWQPLGLFK